MAVLSRHKKTEISGLTLLVGGSLIFLYLTFARCVLELVPHPFCYVYSSNNLWFAWASFLVPLAGLLMLVSIRLTYEKSRPHSQSVDDSESSIG